MQTFSPDSFATVLNCLKLERSNNIPNQLNFLLQYGSSSERCLAKAALDLWFRDGPLSDAVWLLDEKGFDCYLDTSRCKIFG
jgi:hypothetical protein